MALARDEATDTLSSSLHHGSAGKLGCSPALGTEMKAGVGFCNRLSESASGQMAGRIGRGNGAPPSGSAHTAGGAVPAVTQTPRRFGRRGSAVGKYARGRRQVGPRDAARVQMLIE